MSITQTPTQIKATMDAYLNDSVPQRSVDPSELNDTFTQVINNLYLKLIIDNMQGAVATLSQDMIVNSNKKDVKIGHGVLGTSRFVGMVSVPFNPISDILGGYGYHSPTMDASAVLLRGTNSDDVNDVGFELYWGDALLSNRHARVIVDGDATQGNFSIRSFDGTDMVSMETQTGVKGIGILDNRDGVGFYTKGDYNQANMTEHGDRAILDRGGVKMISYMPYVTTAERLLLDTNLVNSCIDTDLGFPVFYNNIDTQWENFTGKKVD
jgi:hypothetical protein